MDLVNFDVAKLPLNTPIVMMTLSGFVLKMFVDQEFYVELLRTGDDTVLIRNANDKWQYLCVNEDRTCSSGRFDGATAFQVKVSPVGRLVFESQLAGYALGVVPYGHTYQLGCHEKYKWSTQSWVILQQHSVKSSKDTLTLSPKLEAAASNVNEEAGRRQLIMHFVEKERPTEEIKKIVDLLYGPNFLSKTRKEITDTAVERRLQILKLIESGQSIEETSEIVALMYGTSGLAKCL